MDREAKHETTRQADHDSAGLLLLVMSTVLALSGMFLRLSVLILLQDMYFDRAGKFVARELFPDEADSVAAAAKEIGQALDKAKRSPGRERNPASSSLDLKLPAESESDA